MALPAMLFEVPPVNPSPGGLFAAVSWIDQPGPPRWATAGVQVRGRNYGGASGTWPAGVCGVPGVERKGGDRINDLAPFLPVTVWGWDACDPTDPADITGRAQLNLRLNEQQDAEEAFAGRLLSDAGQATDLAMVDAVAHLEGLFARTGTVGVIHASAELAAPAEAAKMIVRSGGVSRTPLGHMWVFGGGYVDGLHNVLVGTSPLFGWRTDPVVNVAQNPTRTQIAAVAERMIAVAYEHSFGAVAVKPGSYGSGGGITGPLSLTEDPSGSGLFNTVIQ